MSKYEEYLEFKNRFDALKEKENDIDLDYEITGGYIGVKIAIVDKNEIFVSNKEFAECLKSVISNNRKGLLKKALDKYKRLEASKRRAAVSEVSNKLSL